MKAEVKHSPVQMSQKTPRSRLIQDMGGPMMMEAADLPEVEDRAAEHLSRRKGFLWAQEKQLTQRTFRGKKFLWQNCLRRDSSGGQCRFCWPVAACC